MCSRLNIDYGVMERTASRSSAGMDGLEDILGGIIAGLLRGRQELLIVAGKLIVR